LYFYINIIESTKDKTMVIKKICILSLISISLSGYTFANDNNEVIYDDIDAGSVSSVSSIKSNAVSNLNLMAQSFYLDFKSHIGLIGVPNLKLEYTNNAYTSQQGSSIASLQYADVISYYTLNSNYKIGANLGGGLRQYIGDIEFSSNNDYNQSLNDTIPLSYFDLFYPLNEKNESVGIYTKGSHFNNNTISESGLYYKRNIKSVDNLSLITSYSISKNYFNTDTIDKAPDMKASGINLQLMLSY